MKNPKTAIIDADIIAYKSACYLDIEGMDELESRVADSVKKWTPKGVKDILLAFSCSRRKNFRRDVWESYKAKRDTSASPDCLQEVREYMIDKWDSIVEPRLEADDLLGIYVSKEEMIGVTIDKDLKTIPGYHWNPDKDKKIRYTTVEEADRFFHLQWMTGDSTDGVPGLWRIGPKKADKFLDEWHVDDWEEEILAMYRVRKRTIANNMDSYAFALAMARSIRILREDEYNFDTKEIVLWTPKVVSNNSKEI